MSATDGTAAGKTRVGMPPSRPTPGLQTDRIRRGVSTPGINEGMLDAKVGDRRRAMR